MKIETGSTRKVIVFNSFVLKFPIFSQMDWKAVGLVIRFGISKYIWQDKNFEPNTLGTFFFFESLNVTMYPWTEGIRSNWLEFYYFLITRNHFLTPTYFSFFGLINVQKKVVKIKMSRGQQSYPFNQLFPLINGYYRNAPISTIVPFCHHMLKESYSWDDEGYLVMFDYGNKSVFPFILEKGEEVHRQFHRSNSE